jgi:hypothetical protein
MGTPINFSHLFLDYSSNLGAGTLNKDNDTNVYPSAM